MSAVLVVGPGASLSTTASAATNEVVGCGSNNTATSGDLASFQQDIVTLNGSGGGVITLTANCTYSFTAAYSTTGPYTSWYGPEAFPAIASAITIIGQGAIVQRDPNATSFFRLFYVGADPTNANTAGYATPGAGSLTLQDLTLQYGYAQGGEGSDAQADGGGAGMGGSIFNQGKLTLNRATIMVSTAEGGAGSGLLEGGAGGGYGGGVAAGSSGFGTGFSASGSTGGPGGSASDCCLQAGSGGGGGGFRSSPSENGGSGSDGGAGGAGGPTTSQTGTGGVGAGATGEAAGGTSGDGSGGGGAAPTSTQLLRAGGSGGAGGNFGYGGVQGNGGTGVASDPYSPGGGGGGGGVGGGGGGGGGGESGANGDGNNGGAGGSGGGGGFGGGGGSGGAGGQGGTQGTFSPGANGGNGGNGGAGGFGGGGGGGGAGGAAGIGDIGNGSPGTGGAAGAGGFGGGTGTVAAFNYAGGGGGGAGMGGAIFNDQGQVTLDNATLSDDSAVGGLGGGNGSIICCQGGDGQGLGGAVFNLNGTVATDSSTIAYNTADGGGGIYSLGYSGLDGSHCTVGSCAGASVTVVNSILADSANSNSLQVADLVSNSPTTLSNGADNFAPSQVDVGTYDIVMSSSMQGIGSITGAAPITTDPWAGEVPPVLAANTPSSPTPPFTPPDTLAIDPTSSAYNAGSTTLATDERGVPRPALGADDIGAFEYTLITPTLTVQAPATAGLGDAIQAQAILSGGSQTTGSVTFDLYGPTNTTCTGTPFFVSANNGLSGGEAGSLETNAFTSFGTYRWQVSYSGDNNNFPVTSSCGAATTVVGKATPTLNVGSVSMINAPLSGALYGVPFQDAANVDGYGTASGTVTFNLYGPTDPTCSAAPVFSATITLNNGYAESGPFTATSTTGAGVYHWIASYIGDTNNNPVSGKCGDPGQSVTVTSAPSLVVQPIPTSTGLGTALTAEATLVGGVDNPTGTVTFRLYGPYDTECTEVLFTSTVSLTAGGTATSGAFTPDIYQDLYNPVGTYAWEASYSGDANNPPSVPQTCDASGQTVNVGKANATLTGQATPAQAVPSAAVTDTVTLSGSVNPFGDIEFKLYGPFSSTATPNCTGQAAYSSSTFVQDNQPNAQGQFVVNSGTEQGPARVGVGTYYWVASYAEDTYNNAVSTTCGAAGQTLTVAMANPTLTISQIDPSPDVVGNPVQAQATLGGGASTGIVFFDVYGPVTPGTTCNANSLPTLQAFLYTIDGNSEGNGNVDGDGVYTSDVFTPTAPGLYFWEAHYTPTNTIDNPADEVCGPNGTLTVTSGGTTPQTIDVSASPTSTSWANTSTVTASGYSGAGALSYTLDEGSNGNTSDPACSLSGPFVSASGAGTCYVYASVAADTTYESATSADVPVTFTPAAQSITALASPTPTPWNTTVNVSSSGSQGLGTISYSLDDGTNGNTSDQVCSLSGSSLTATAAGTCYVYATIGADPNYLGATSADVEVTFTKLSQSITASASPTSTGWANSSIVSSYGTSGSGPITYSLDTGTNGNTSSPLCQLTGTTLSATGGGVCYVYASIGADTTYEGATSADVPVTFTPETQTITASASPNPTSWANSSTVSSSGSSGLGLITYALDNGSNGNTSDAVCHISGQTVSATGAGSCYVYAMIAADGNYQSATSADVLVTFTPATQTITASASPTSTSWANSSNLSSSGSSGTGPISYALDAGTNGHTSGGACLLSGATLSSSGGATCYVYAMIGSDANYQSATSADVMVTFTPVPQTITASASPTTTSWANSSALGLSGSSPGTGSVTLSLDDGSNGHVSDAVCQLTGGTLSATGVGTCYAYAKKAADDSYQSATSADVMVTFTQAAQSITAVASPTSTGWTTPSAISSSGSSGTGPITYSLDDGTNGNTSDPVCQLSGTSLSATAPGTCYVYDSIGADAEYLGAVSNDVTVTFGKAAQSISASVSPTSTTWGNTSTVSSSGATGSGAVTYALDEGTNGHSSSSVCALHGTTISATAAGSCYVYASVAADANYAAATSSDATVTFTNPAPQKPAGHGYWLVGSDGGIFSFGSAQFYGSTGGMTLNRPVVGISPTAADNGYWLVASDGGVFAFDAPFVGSVPGLGINSYGSGLPHSLNAPIVGMVPAATGGGYFLVASDGGVFAFNANFEGSCYSIGGCAGAAVSVIPDASGNGYWLITSTGNVYAFGDASYLGAPGVQSTPITSAVATPDRGGYWIMDGTGQVFAYGDAAGLGGLPPGSTGSLNPALAIFADTTHGYWISTAQGAVSKFGDAPFDGDMSGTKLNGAIIAATGF